MEMADDHIGSTPVVKDRKLVGIFTATDACRSFAEHLRAESEELPPSVA